MGSKGRCKIGDLARSCAVFSPLAYLVVLEAEGVRHLQDEEDRADGHHEEGAKRADSRGHDKDAADGRRERQPSDHPMADRG